MLKIIFTIITLMFSMSLFAQGLETQESLEYFKKQVKALGEPRIKGEETVITIEGKEIIPILFYGKTKINNTSNIVDEVKKKMGGTATIFLRRKMSLVMSILK